MEKNVKSKNESLYILLFALLALYFLSMAAMFLWGAMTSLKDPFDYGHNRTGLPEVLLFSNYVKAFTSIKVQIRLSDGGYGYVGIMRMYLNSVLYTFGCAFFSTFVPCITGYMCAKYRYKLSNMVVLAVIVTMSLPIVGNAPSMLQLVRNLGMYNTMWGIWLMSASFQMGMHFLILYYAFRGMPDSYKEAAEIDGASQLQVIIKIMLPLVKSAFFTVFLLRLIGLWNDYQTPLLYIPDLPTIAYGLFRFSFVDTMNDTFSVPMQITASFLVCIPIFTLFLVFQNRIMTNVSIGGIKG